jgi:hypothetical protein
MDDNARAIARLAEEAKAEKSSESRKDESAQNAAPRRQPSPLAGGSGRRKAGGPTPQASTKRTKMGGGG